MKRVKPTTSLGGLPIYKPDGSRLTAGDIEVGKVVRIRIDPKKRVAVVEPGFDRKAYQREYQRKLREDAKRFREMKRQ